MGADRYAYQSKLRRADPVAKLVFAMVVTLVCLVCESITVGLGTLLIMSVLTVTLGGQKPKIVRGFLNIPIVFLFIGCITIVVRPLPETAEALISFRLLGQWRWGVSEDFLIMGLGVFFKAMGTIASMCFLSLTTPMSDIVLALERLRVPKLFVELMELIYRFIFVLLESANCIRIAQESRLGYQGFRKSVECLGVLSSMVFLRAWRRGDKVWSALESRGYTGTLNTLGHGFQKSGWLYGLTALVVAFQLVILYFVRRYLA